MFPRYQDDDPYTLYTPKSQESCLNRPPPCVTHGHMGGLSDGWSKFAAPFSLTDIDKRLWCWPKKEVRHMWNKGPWLFSPSHSDQELIQTAHPAPQGPESLPNPRASFGTRRNPIGREA